MHVTILAPAHWQDFELLCRDLFAAVWNAPATRRNGRAGQPQAGVDVLAPGAMGWIGLQRKVR